MNDIKKLLAATNHRPWQIPNKKWQYYQEWNDALFLHFEVDYEKLRKLVPKELIIDTFQGKAFISIVSFKMEKIRPRNLPPLDFISDFLEINVRTYIDVNNKKGVFFINIEAEKLLSAIIAKNLSGLPYEKSNITRTKNGYKNNNLKKGFLLDVDFNLGQEINSKKDFDRWITERYSLYLEKNKSFVMYEIHHKEWQLFNIDLEKLKIHYNLKSILELTENSLHSFHYSPGVQVVSWKYETLQ